jgi:hypothetical protein
VRSTDGIASSKPAEGVDLHLFVFMSCVVSGLCHNLIVVRGRLCVCVCVCVCSTNVDIEAA